MRTDNTAVKWLCGMKELNGKFAPWVLDLQDFFFKIYHLKGNNDRVADALSRNPVPREDQIDQTEHLIRILVCKTSTGYSPQELAFP